MKIVLVIIFIIALLFLQIGIFPHLEIANACPNLIFLAVISLAIIKGWRENLGWIIVGGLFLDFYSLHNFPGISVVILLLAGFLSQFLSQRFFKKNDNLSLVFIFLICFLVYEILQITVFKTFGIGFNFSLIASLVRIIYNSILALPVFYIIKWHVSKFQKI